MLPPLSLPTPPKLSRLGRALAAAQAAKETLSFLLLVLPLALEAPLVLVSALPGLGLYLLHLYLAGGRASRVLAVAAWVLTLADELWAVLLYHDLGAPLPARRLHLSHCLGIGLSLLALAELAWRWPRRRRPAAPAGPGPRLA
ncbi:hypothetical protein [Hymenobacter sp. PAMC 26628]|uniref:hypothetical protein n=1 Tax=Hymenobacter sp. PAMC 26628 TaxID=1484118 RepID=UPI00077022A1|nr:hypothetical protein [Hymenobacter sp. PAMC 26628]AMJ66853.1 hypothetical protein AXW84_16525 [Hymenobacter sp. PAMC 26628]